MRLPLFQEPIATAGFDTGFDTGPRSISAVRVLRISVTDRCNFRCTYCMPADGVSWLPREDLLSYEEIAQVARAAAREHGIGRFKITGGEPTVRRGLTDLIAQLRRIDGVEDLSLTTNGLLLESLAHPFKQAGLDRITVSIDSLRPDRFRAITRTGDLAAVLRGLDAAEDAGLTPIKINCVTMRGVNDDELVDFARLTLDRAVTVRFIEYMPLGDSALQRSDDALLAGAERGPAAGCGSQDRGAAALVSEAEVRQRIESGLGPLLPVPRESEAGVGPANVYRLASADPRGRIGFISAMSQPFCSTCNRLRLTADGMLRSCLFEGGEVDVRSILRGARLGDRASAALGAAMSDCVRNKPLLHGQRGDKQMSRIGG